jgi:hypothetical protein
VSKTVTTFKFFWAHEDEQQEAWLRRMAQQGMHLVGVNPLCFWTFRRGEPADTVYRIDAPATSQDPSFQQLMLDAGWSLAATTVGWHYWRTPAVPGRTPELFTDNASRAKKFRNRLAMLVGSALPLLLILVIVDKPRALAQLSLPFLAPLCVVLVLYMLAMPYSILRLTMRIRRLSATETV